MRPECSQSLKKNEALLIDFSTPTCPPSCFFPFALSMILAIGIERDVFPATHVDMNVQLPIKAETKLRGRRDDSAVDDRRGDPDGG